MLNRALRPSRSSSDATAVAVLGASARIGRAQLGWRPAAALCLSLLTLSLAACGDAETARRVDIDRSITEIAGEYRRAIATRTADSADRTAGELAALLSRAGSISASGPQQSAASLLAANIAHALATVEAERIRDYESTVRQARAIVANAAEASAALASVADAQSGLSLTADRTFLQERKAEAEASLRAAQEAARQLENPVATLSAAALERRQALTALERQAEDLRRQANAVDAISGFPLIETRAEVLEQVRATRTALSLEELALASMRPELDLANAMLVANQALVSAADNALAELDNFASTLRSDADRSRTESDRLRKVAEETLARLRELQAGPLAQSYERAMTALEQAANHASRASGELNAVGARTKLSAESMRAALLAQQAASAEQDAILHAHLGAAGALFGGEAKQRPLADAATARRDELVEAAKGSLTSAIEMLDQLSGGEDPALLRSRAALQGSLAALEGRVESTVPAGSQTGAPAGAAAALGRATYTTFGPGFPSTDALLAAFQAAENDPAAGMQAGRRGLAVSRREFADLLRLGFAVGEDMTPLLTAVTERFGAETAMGIMSGMSTGPGGGAGIPSVTYKAIERDGRRVLAAVASTGETTELELVQVGSAWYAVADPIFKDVDRSMLAQMSQIGPMMDMMRGPMKAAFAEVAQKVRSGEISSAEEIQRALMQAMARQMGGG